MAHRGIDYVLEERLDYVIGWEMNIDFLRYYSSRPVDDALEPLGRIPGFRSWNYDWFLYRVRRDPGKARTP